MKNINKMLEQPDCNPHFKKLIEKYSKDLSAKDFDMWIKNIAKHFYKCRNKS